MARQVFRLTDLLRQPSELLAGALMHSHMRCGSARGCRTSAMECKLSGDKHAAPTCLVRQRASSLRPAAAHAHHDWVVSDMRQVLACPRKNTISGRQK